MGSPRLIVQLEHLFLRDVQGEGAAITSPHVHQRRGIGGWFVSVYPVPAELWSWFCGAWGWGLHTWRLGLS